MHYVPSAQAHADKNSGGRREGRRPAQRGAVVLPARRAAARVAGARACGRGWPWAAILLLLSLSVLPGCSRQAKLDRHLSRAARYFQHHEFSAARIEYMNVLRLAPTNRIAIRQIGLASYELGDLTQANAFLAKAEQLEPTNLTVRLKLGSLYLIGGRTESARERAEFILSKEPNNFEALMLWVGTATTSNRLDEALQRVKAVEPQFGERAQFHTVLAGLYMQKADYAAAEQALKNAISRDPKSGAAHTLLGDLCALERDSARAVQEYQKAIEVSSPASPARIKLANLKWSGGDRQEARRVLQEAVRLAPDYQAAAFRLAELTFAEQDYPKCAELLKGILARQPSHFQAFVLQQKVRLATGKRTEALDAYAKALVAFPRAPDLRYQAALAYLQAGEARKAMTELRQAIALAPRFGEAILLLAELNTRTGNLDAAVAALEAYLEQAPNVGQTYVLLGAAYRLQKEPARAVDVYRKLIKLAPRSPQGSYLLGMALLQQNKTGEAAKCFDDALALAPAFAEPLAQLVALDLAAKKSPAEVVGRVQKQLALAPDAAGLTFLLGRIYAAQHDWVHAEEALQKTVELQPDLSGAYLALSYVYAASGQDDEALARLDKALTTRTNDVALLMLRAGIYERKHDVPKAREQYERILVTSPQSVAALNNLACLDAGQPETREKAFELAKKARDLAPKDPYVADTLGWIAYQRGEYKWALSLLQESAEQMPQQPEIMYHLGLCQCAIGDEDAARETLAEALAASKDFSSSNDAARLLSVLQIDLDTADKSALPKLEELLAKDAHNVSALTRAGSVCERSGDFEQARKHFEKAVALNPLFVPALTRLAKLDAEHFKEIDRALDLAKKARDAAPKDPRIAETLGWLTYQKGDYKWAQSLLQECVAQFPNDPEVRYHLGMALYMVGNVEAAEKTVRGAVELSATFRGAEDARRFLQMMDLSQHGGDAQALAKVHEALSGDAHYLPALMAMTAAYHATADAAKEKATLADIVARYPAFGPAARDLAALYLKSPGEQDQAYKVATKARELLPADPAVALLLGKITYQRGEFEWAARLIQEGLAKLPHDQESLFYLGMCRYRLGDKTAAKDLLSQALQGDANFPEAQNARKTLKELE